MRILRKLSFILLASCAFSLSFSQEKKNSVFSMSTEPEFPGGISELYKYIQKNLVYPTHYTPGKVYISFLVNEEGKLDSIKTFKSLGAAMDKAAEELVAKMPKWKPALRKGKPISAIYLLPVKFSAK